MTLISECRTRGIDVFRYGADLPSQARKERARNLWAVRWLYAHLLSGGLCMRPPHSLVDHVGFDDEATNAMDPWKCRGNGQIIRLRIARSCPKNGLFRRSAPSAADCGDPCTGRIRLSGS